MSDDEIEYRYEDEDEGDGDGDGEGEEDGDGDGDGGDGDEEGEGQEYVSDSEEKETAQNDITQHNFTIPDASYRILDYKEICPMMYAYIEEIAALLRLDHDIIQILFRKLKWNKERLLDLYYTDRDDLFTNAGITFGGQIPKNTSSIVTCRICGDENSYEQVFGLACGHKFCRDCYSTYLEHQVRDGPPCVFAHCPEYQCKQAMTRSAFLDLCSPPIAEKYIMYITRNFIETSSYMRWCPSPGCERVAIGSGITTVRCLCSFPFCFRCGQEAHDPSSCSQLAMWQEKCQNESETANWILANTKKCPKCQTRIEKNQGCNHMSCKMCKHEFCWICMGPWSDHGQNTGGFYKCNKYSSAPSDSTVEKAKAELDRYLHYYQRYHGHDSALGFASRQREFAEKRMMDLQQTERSAWVDVQFLKQAVEQVIECRRVLKYTYVLGHFLKDGTAGKELYEHHQEMLEKHTEKLSELTEKLNQSELDRSHVVNLTRVTERFMTSMLNTVMDGSHQLEMISSMPSGSNGTATGSVANKAGRHK